MKKKAWILAVLFMLCFTGLQAQSGVEMADELRGSGKIYVVVASLVVIFAGIIFYLYRIEKRLNKLEKEQK
jgi:CcmD family protein